MKSVKTLIAGLILLMFLNVKALAQNDRYQLYVVHEDHVKEGMMDKHKEGDKKIVKAAKDQNMKNMSWITFVADNNRVMYLSPIENMAELDKNPFDELEKKMGEEEFDKLFDSFDGTYSEHGDYILRLDNELSYMPNGMTVTPEGEHYRELTYYHIPPGEGEKAEEIAREVKKLYSEKNSNLHYRLYKSGFGNMGYYFMVAVAAKSPAEMEEKRKKNIDIIGDEGKAVLDKVENNFRDTEKVTGYIMPDLSYMNN
ncbi:hypothetical protein GCM10023115_49260 [Pontixanthobacter gangjinensis]|uniref:Uncharacterized protein n=1 Tax=Christiangramia aestuarii TaxID=1028746 RepID=A0A7K1LNZ6_9FLAO|nr:hypothetical protein [Christiangramia aestuarii]MUP42507.1 hypothetical protein [Christiangramia aestuarii]